jgi:diaminohydroxyphosphoribosylaminopyrimidine deaminase/5-amino-6-(5-phosphoribosylamino)uracil reductase
VSASDAHLMRIALALAEGGRGRVEPNPVVGCVVVRDGSIAGRGGHRVYGGPHAEIEALAVAGEAARGADLVVTLEPCGHHGKTPPCAEAIARAGVRRVVYAASDPNPEANGKGLAILAEAGIEVRGGVLAEEARALNVRFERWLAGARPWVIAKWGASLDGRVADAAGGSRYITGEASRKLVHEIRAAVDAIVVGAGTVLADDPSLTCRTGGASPHRVILDRRLRTPPDARVVATAAEVPTTILARPGVDGGRRGRARAPRREGAARRG